MVKVADPDLPLEVAVIVADPAATPVAMPVEALTVAIAELLEDQLTVLVIS